MLIDTCQVINPLQLVLYCCQLLGKLQFEGWMEKGSVSS